jgi:hypothetical protein
MFEDSERFVTFVNEHAINEQLTMFEKIAYLEDAELIEDKGKYVFKARLTALPNVTKAQVGAYLLWLNALAFGSMNAYYRPLGRLLSNNVSPEHNLHVECWDSPSVFPELTAADFAQKVADAWHSDFFMEDDPRTAQDSWKWKTPDETQFEMKYYNYSDESFGAVYLADRQLYLETQKNWNFTSRRLVKFIAYEARLASQGAQF